jgi:DNA-binding MarR family transcriptional regulator
MSWTSGYVRLDDRYAAPHPALRRRLAFVVQDAARNVRAAVDRELREEGLVWWTFALLLVLSEVDGLAQQTLATKAGIDRNRASAVLRDLEYEGYVTRRRSRADARQVGVSITPEGRALVAAGIRAVERGERKALRGFRAREQARLHELLARLVRDDTPAFFRRF